MIKSTILIVIFFWSNNLFAQQNEIQLKTNYGSDNKEIHELLRFEGIETINLKFSGKTLKGKDYTILIKEFTNGTLSKIDTLSSSENNYLQPIDTTIFKFKFFVKTQLDNTIKMTSIFDRFSTTKRYDIKKNNDSYALHDFLNGNKSLKIEIGKPTYILGYFLPYLDKKTGWKKYCEVAGSEHNPENWGTVFNISNYFLIEILFR